ncbi:MetQ/NlpA family ABC transporter substrate-binding protein [Galactobacter caseinivorans]|uniref:Lipoprotein n=1 Tax=Galactobacter caseinivorans TaxID=2676123 RepID=A0A496PMG3_9MICC|nr:MetQ/NlpA family ABC transporter substrate-binding protein [Galactobacter caseinivorans]RKW71614.1 ABC transporter [Galactobacter caseinivorans]
MRKKFSFAALAAVAALALSACGAGSTPAASSAPPLDPAKPVKITVAASPIPHGKILQYVKDNLTKDSGIELEIKEVDDYITPNTSLQDKSVDANFFQHLPYLEAQSKDKGYKFAHGEGIHLEPISAYSEKYQNAADIPEGSTIAITNDASNQVRSLKVLQDAGVLKDIQDTDTALAISGDASADKNPKKLVFNEMNPEVVVQQIKDPKVAAAIVNGNFVLSAKLDQKPIAVESAENNPYANFLVWRDGEETPAVKKLDELLHSPEVKAYIEKTWPDKSVIPAF